MTAGRRLAAVPATAPRALLYLRQSVSREESISLELQETAGREYCTRRGYVVTEVLADPGISGRTWVRPAVQRAVGMIEAQEADVIVVWKWSRLSRSRRDWAVAVDRVEAAGGRLESSTEPVDTTTSTGRFTRGMLAELAAFESERIGDTWKETHRRRLSLGLPSGGGARVGYTYDGTAKTYLVDPDTAPIVHELYRRYVEGAGYSRLSDWLLSIGLMSHRTGAPWTGHGIRNQLDSGFAAGFLRVHDPDCTRRHAGKACNQRVLVPGAQEPILSPEEWEAYRDARDRRLTIAPRLLSPVSRLSGAVRCLTCGRRMTVARFPAETGKKDRLKCGHNDCTLRRSVRMDVAEAAVLAWLPTVADLVDEAASAQPKASASDAVERERLARSAMEAERALTRLTVDWARRVIPESAYIGARDALTEQRDSASAALDALARRSESSEQFASVSAALLADWETLAPADCSRILQELAVVWVGQHEPGGKGSCRVLGVWEDQPRDFPTPGGSRTSSVRR